MQGRIETAPREQLLVGAGLDDLAIAHHRNEIGTLDRRFHWCVVRCRQRDVGRLGVVDHGAVDQVVHLVAAEPAAPQRLAHGDAGGAVDDPDGRVRDARGVCETGTRARGVGVRDARGDARGGDAGGA